MKITDILPSIQLVEANSPVNKVKLPFMVNGLAKWAATATEGFMYSHNTLMPYQVNGVAVNLAQIGTRPAKILRYEASFPNQTKFLIKFDDKSVYLSDINHSLDTPVVQRTGTIIADSAQDLRYLFLTLLGAGGGGGGNQLTRQGGGGSAGAMLHLCLKIEGNIAITCGAGGVSADRQNGTTGGETSISSLGLYAKGGNGGYTNNSGTSGVAPIYQDTANIAQVLFSRISASGGGSGADGGNFNSGATTNYAPTGESNSITYGTIAGGGHTLIYGGGGGSSAFAKGGKGGAYNRDGYNAEGIGAGGGGAGAGADKKGGNGGNGAIKIYY